MEMFIFQSKNLIITEISGKTLESLMMEKVEKILGKNCNGSFWRKDEKDD